MHRKKRKERSFSFLSDTYQVVGELEQGLSIKVVWEVLLIEVEKTFFSPSKNDTFASVACRTQCCKARQ